MSSVTKVTNVGNREMYRLRRCMSLLLVSFCLAALASAFVRALSNNAQSAAPPFHTNTTSLALGQNNHATDFAVCNYNGGGRVSSWRQCRNKDATEFAACYYEEEGGRLSRWRQRRNKRAMIAAAVCYDKGGVRHFSQAPTDDDGEEETVLATANVYFDNLASVTKFASASETIRPSRGNISKFATMAVSTFLASLAAFKMLSVVAKIGYVSFVVMTLTNGLITGPDEAATLMFGRSLSEWKNTLVEKLSEAAQTHMDRLGIVVRGILQKEGEAATMGFAFGALVALYLA